MEAFGAQATGERGLAQTLAAGAGLRDHARRRPHERAGPLAGPGPDSTR